MWLVDRLKEAVGITPAPPPPSKPVREAASAQSTDEPGWRRLSGDGLSNQNDRDLSPMAQDRMQKVAEYLWQSNLLANRLVELPLAYLLGHVLWRNSAGVWMSMLASQACQATILYYIFTRRDWQRFAMSKTRNGTNR